jgi:hypothetical protein
VDIDQSRQIATAWLAEETKYADEKYGTREEEDIWMGDEGMSDDGLWFNELANRLQRVQVLGVNTPLGRQAMGKFAKTAISAFESMIRTWGVPIAGKPSGEQ